MKKFVFLIFAILFLCICAQAQEPISFRSQALGGIVYDDLDLIYDPIQLRFVDMPFPQNFLQARKRSIPPLRPSFI